MSKIMVFYFSTPKNTGKVGTKQSFYLEVIPLPIPHYSVCRLWERYPRRRCAFNYCMCSLFLFGLDHLYLLNGPVSKGRSDRTGNLLQQLRSRIGFINSHFESVFKFIGKRRDFQI